MEQPPILRQPDADLSVEAVPVSGHQPPDSARSMRGMVLATAGVAVAVLAVCNGLLLWLYQHSSLGVVVTLGTFIAGVSLAWLRNRTRQLTVIVLYIQALIAVAVVAGILAGMNAPTVWTGVLLAGITLAGLLVLSVIGLIYYTGARTRLTTVLSLGTAVAVTATAIWTYVDLLAVESYSPEERRQQAYDPGHSVDFLIEDGQYYTGDLNQDSPAAKRAFLRYTCPESREELMALFASLVQDGNHLGTPENVKEGHKSLREGRETTIVTGSITLLNDSESVVTGPETWRFHLERTSGDEYWRVCRIDRPSGS